MHDIVIQKPNIHTPKHNIVALTPVIVAQKRQNLAVNTNSRKHTSQKTHMLSFLIL